MMRNCGFGFLVACICSPILLGSGPASAADDLRIIKDVPYKTGELSDYERERCKVDLYLPAKSDGFATIVWFHGGGLQSGDKGGAATEAFARRFAAEGVAIASANYRLHPQARFPAYVDDAAAAFAFVRREIARHGGDPQRVFISGHSAGGYLTAMVGFDPRYLQKQGLALGDICGLLPISGQMVTHSTVRRERGIPETRPVIDEAAPAWFVGKEAPPVLCIAGSDDMPARAEENRYFVAAAKAAGHGEATYREVAGRDHNTIANRLGRPDDEVARAMLTFVGQVRKPAAPRNSR